MKRFPFYPTLLLLGCGLVSCGSLQTLSFDQLSPAEVSFPENVRNIAVVNNMPVAPQTKKMMATVGRWDGDGKQATEALAGALADSKYFSQVMICDSALNSQTEMNDTRRVLSSDEVEQLSSDLGADMIFSLDRLLIENKREEFVYPGMLSSLPVMVTVVTPILSVYASGREKAVRVVAESDSLVWELSGVPSDRQMTEEASRMAASMLTHRLVPYWAKVERPYYSGGNVGMRDAAVCVNEGDWEGAYQLWKELFENRKSGKAKTRAALNLVLASEMLGRLDEAASWLEEARKGAEEGSEEEMVIKFYKVQLEKRTQEMPLLNAQMGRFDNNFQ